MWYRKNKKERSEKKGNKKTRDGKKVNDKRGREINKENKNERKELEVIAVLSPS